jgi:uncharacterized phage protein (TIGR01671 family)
MREIKFRAWDKKDKIMWEPMTLSDLILGGWEMENADCSWSLPNEDYIQFSHDDTIWIRFTGLKDKNGKEIYEGDLFRWCGNIREILWISSAYRCGWNIAQGNGTDGASSIEIIGNKYENPELLSEKSNLQ